MRYAAYGSNLLPQRLQIRVPSATLCGVTLVSGWSLAFHKQGMDGSAKANIVPADSSVFFALFDIDPAEKPQLDIVEGPGYAVTDIEIPDFGACFCYVAKPDRLDHGLRPFSWYRELVIAGLEYHVAPADYVEAVRRVGHVADDDVDRHALHMSILAKARSDRC